MKFRKIAALLLAAAMLLSGTALAVEPPASVPPPRPDLNHFVKSRAANPAAMTDLKADHWARALLVEAYEYGILNGSGNLISPAGTLTAAELTAIVSRMHAIYHNYGTPEDMYPAGEQWYDVYVAYADAFDLLPDALASQVARAPGQPVTRAAAFQAVYNVVWDEDLQPQNTVFSLPDMAAGSVGYAEIVALFEAGVLTGHTGGVVDPNGLLTRAEFAAVFMRLLDKGVGVRASGQVYGTATMADMEAILGSAQKSYQHSDNAGLVSRVYHDGNYENFYMVQYRNNRVTAVARFLDTKAIAFGTPTGSSTLADPYGVGDYLVLEYTNDYVKRCGDDTAVTGLFYALANGLRVYYGLEPLARNSVLDSVAEGHSSYLVETGEFSHTGRNGTSPFDRMKDAGYNFGYAGENIIESSEPNPLTYLNMWVNSQGHRNNILSGDYTETGVSFVSGIGTQVFAAPW